MMPSATVRSRLPHLLQARRLLAAVVLALLLAGPLSAAAATDWGRAVVDTTMRRHPDPATLGRWIYRFGLQMYGHYLVFKRTGEHRQLEYVKGWVDSHVDAEGNIDQPLDMLDMRMPGVLLLALYRETAEPKPRQVRDL